MAPPSRPRPIEPTAADLDRLAAFPEQNPNLVIEVSVAGEVVYLNPEAAARFPELFDEHVSHPLLAGLLEYVESFRSDGREFASREVIVGEAVFEEKVCHTLVGGRPSIRVYAHDITALKNAEHQIAELARGIVHAQEEERHRVSRELHDEAGQALVALKISLQLLAGDAPEELKPSLNDAVDLVDSTRERIRRLAQGLRPPSLDALGLDRALAQLCAETDELTHLHVRYAGTDLISLNDEGQVSLYRFVQEALTNAAIHAQAHQVAVRMSDSDDEVRVSVADDGIGMDPGTVTDPIRSGLGIVGMRERLELLAGRLEVTTSEWGGTEVVAYLPSEAPA